jgi:hypothetical protein
MLDQANPIVSDFSRILREVLGILPEVLAAGAILLLGWIVARILRGFTIRSAALLNRGIASIGQRTGARIGGLREASVRMVGGIIYWLVLLFFLASATNVLGLAMFAGWLDRIVAYLPKIVSGVFIVAAGVVLSNIARDSVRATFGKLADSQRAFLARGAQVTTLTLLAIVGFEQIGVDVSVITTVLAIVVACLLGGLSIAFSLGARVFVSNLIGAYYLSDDYRPGARIRIDDSEGTILDITSIAVVLETAEGRLTVPARLFSEQATLLVTAGTDNV